MSKLPSGYKRLEYIQSSGTQYIKTGFKPNQDTRLEIVAAPMSIDDAAQGAGFIPYGAGTSYNSNTFECFTASNQFEFNYDGQYDFIGTAEIGTVFSINHDKNNVTVSKGSQVSGTKAFSYKSFTATTNLTLFAVNRGSMLCGLLKLYSCQIYDNGTLIHDFVPCKNVSGTVGLYDTVNGQFYANAGTGTFTAGPEIIPDPPAAPSGLQTVLAVVLQWAASANADRYDVYRDGAKLGSTEGTQYVDTTPEANHTYIYTVKAVNGGGESAGTSITVYTKSGYFEYKPLIESANFP